jgi:WD40 repeat protein
MQLRGARHRRRPARWATFLNGRQVLSGSGNNTLKLWDAASGALLRTYQGHSDRVQSVA